jgi:hypothetical protein
MHLLLQKDHTECKKHQHRKKQDDIKGRSPCQMVQMLGQGRYLLGTEFKKEHRYAHHQSANQAHENGRQNVCYVFSVFFQEITFDRLKVGAVPRHD